MWHLCVHVYVYACMCVNEGIREDENENACTHTRTHTGFVEDTSFSWCAMACFTQQHREQQPLSLFLKKIK